MTDAAAVLDDAYRRDWAFVLAATVRACGDLDLAEECVQDAFVSALAQWQEEIPRNPAAWLTTTARRRAIDAIRREANLRTKLPLLVDRGSGGADPGLDLESPVIEDDRLRLVFLCCHPALAGEAQVALTLRLVCGLSTPQIARAFLVSESTMSARITRAKKKIRIARIPFRLPDASDLPDRLDAVLTVIHLLFTSGHTAASGDALVDAELVRRSIDLARLLHRLLPQEPEVQGLLALLLLTHARTPARTDGGRLVLLENQDRTLWDRGQISEGQSLVAAALRHRPPGRFALQAAIAAVHDEAPTYEATDWFQILGLYNTLLIAWPSPVVALNRAVAAGMVFGWDESLRLLDDLESSGQLEGYPYLAGARADVLRRLGRPSAAAEAYRLALDLVDNDPERTYLRERLAEVDPAADSTSTQRGRK